MKIDSGTPFFLESVSAGENMINKYEVVSAFGRGDKTVYSLP